MVIRMKKIISIFIFLLLLVGCSLSNSPTSKVEDLLTKYQTLDKDIVNGINSIIEEENFTSIQKDRYKKKKINQKWQVPVHFCQIAGQCSGKY